MGLHEIIHVEFSQQRLGPARPQQTAANAAEARKWPLGVEAGGCSESEDSALLEWGLARVGVGDSGVGLVLL